MKRCMSICCVFAMAVGLSFGVSTDTQAASEGDRRIKTYNRCRIYWL